MEEKKQNSQQVPTSKNAMPDTYFNRGAELIKKIARGEAKRADVQTFTQQVVFDLQIGNIDNVLQKYVMLKNLSTLLKSIEKELQKAALDEASLLPKDQLSNVYNARVTIKKSAPDYEFDDARWQRLKTELMAKEVLIEETKLDLANLREELQILAKILLDEGKKALSETPSKDTLTITML